jgi:hypothetical protein
MKHLSGILLAIIFTTVSFAQQSKFAGIWEGDLDAGMQKLKLVFIISQNKSGQLKLAMQSPQQSAMQMPADTVIVVGETINMEMKKFKLSFSGKLINDTIINGEFTQGQVFDLLLKKVEKPTTVTKPKRPQTPKPPFTYKSIEVSFSNKDQSLKLGATLTLPDTATAEKYPAVILITGSGAQDRDETMFGHKPFAVIADHLTKKGFAVLRVDDRGVGKSTGNHSLATSADFANDTEAALDYLLQNKFINTKNIGLIGHSEGGQIAPMVAAKRKEVKFIVLLAGPGIPCVDLMAEQNVAIFKSKGLNTSTADQYGPLFKKLVLSIITSKDSATAFTNGLYILQNWQAPDSVKAVFNVATDTKRFSFVKAMVAGVYNPWFRYFISYDPVPNLKKLSCAVLALNGSKDLQVLPASNLAGIKNALQKGKAKNYEIKDIPQLNHLFQTCRQCTLDEYATLEESFSPVALDIITEWLLKQVN